MNIRKTFNSRCRSALVAVLLLGLAGCVSTPPTPELSGPAEAQRAMGAEARGNYAEAAELWQQAAMVTTGPDREVFRVRAAEAWMQAGREDQSSATLAGVDSSKLSGGSLARYSLLNAELALQSGDLDRAEFYLDVAAPGGSPDLRAWHERLRQRTARLRTDPAGFALATLASALREMDRYDEPSGVALLQLLEDVPSRQLQAASQSAVMAERLDDWPGLALAIRQALVSRTDLEDVADRWAADHPGHAVGRDGFVALATAYGSLFTRPGRIAVLLPNEGGLAAAGKAIRDGLVSAYLDSGDPASLQFHPTSETPESAVSGYYAALNEGAEWIIGPLRRESVDAISRLGSPGVPFLMLNTPAEAERSPAQDLIFSLSLSQELEAQAIARQALESGMTSVIMLYPENAWGLRAEAAFAEAFVAGGGTITARTSFSPAESDHGELLKQLLQIDQSEQRKNRLQATLGIPLDFEPTRRDDFDLIFLAAEPEQGRQIRPQLRFYDAGSKPVMAMGRIFSGRSSRDLDLDLNGIVFPTTRWHLRPHPDASELASVRNGSMGSLHDLGADAWRIIPWLPLLRKDPDLRFLGEVGALHVDKAGIIRREPIWARFAGGLPVPLDSGDRDL